MQVRFYYTLNILGYLSTHNVAGANKVLAELVCKGWRLTICLDARKQRKSKPNAFSYASTRSIATRNHNTSPTQRSRRLVRVVSHDHDKYAKKERREEYVQECKINTRAM
jgi:hypothetical protein